MIPKVMYNRHLAGGGAYRPKIVQTYIYQMARVRRSSPAHNGRHQPPIKEVGVKGYGVILIWDLNINKNMLFSNANSDEL